MILEQVLLVIAVLQLLMLMLLGWKHEMLKDRVAWLENRQVVTDVKWTPGTPIQPIVSKLKDVPRA